MKGFFLAIFSCILMLLPACAGNLTAQSDSAGLSTSEISDASQPLKLSILGDSYSTFEGWIPDGYIAWYKPIPKEGRPTDVTEVDQTWWKILMNEQGYELETNNSYSGSTVCNTGYNGKDYSDQSFVSRVGMLGNPDLIVVFGGTNDSWANSPIGDYKWTDWTNEDLYSYRPATAYLIANMKDLYPEAEIIFILNDDIKDEIKQSTAAVCDHYGVKYVQLTDVDKISGHPSSVGMRRIASQVSKLI